MRRMLSVWFPAWPIDRMRRATRTRVSDDRPFALVHGIEGRLTITAVNAQALREGVAPGKALADARAAVPALLSAPGEPARDLAALKRLALWLGRYGPAVHLEDPLSRMAAARPRGSPPRRERESSLLSAPDGASIDITGVAHLFGGEEQLLADLERRLGGFGIAMRAGIADTVGAAHAIARHGRDRIAAPGRTREALGALPVEALRILPSAAQALRRLGLRRIGDLYALPRPALARRFPGRDMAAAVLDRLDQALGSRPEPRRPMRAPPDLAVRLPFAEPLLSAEGFEAALEEAARRLSADLTAAGRGARSIALTAYRSDGSRASAAIGLSRPSRSAAHMARLLNERSADLDMGLGIDLIELAAGRTEPLDPAQTLLAGGEERGAAGALGELADRLSNRLGASRVTRLLSRPSHIPERAQALAPVLGGIPDGSGPPPITAARPPLLLASPEPVEVVAEVPDGPPVRLLWRRKSRRIVRAEGPERIAHEWWRPFLGLAPASPALERARDYYRIEDEEGGRYWVFRAGLYGEGAETPAPAWYLHGLYG